MSCVRCIVSGRVQGVWFRQTTRTQAQRLGVSGSAINLADGTVEVIACGRDDAVSSLREWLRTGAPLSRVEQVICEELPGHVPPTGFVTG